MQSARLQHMNLLMSSSCFIPSKCPISCASANAASSNLSKSYKVFLSGCVYLFSMDTCSQCSGRFLPDALHAIHLIILTFFIAIPRKKIFFTLSKATRTQLNLIVKTHFNLKQNKWSHPDDGDGALGAHCSVVRSSAHVIHVRGCSPEQENWRVGSVPIVGCFVGYHGSSVGGKLLKVLNCYCCY